MHDRRQQTAFSIGQNMPLAPFDLSPGIVAARAAIFRGPDRLAVDDTGGRARLLTNPIPGPASPARG